LLRCTVLLENNEQCPVAALRSHRESCYFNSFPNNFYEHSIDNICQYVLRQYCYKSTCANGDCYFLAASKHTITFTYAVFSNLAAHPR